MLTTSHLSGSPSYWTSDPFTEIDRVLRAVDRAWLDASAGARDSSLLNAYHDNDSLVVTTELPGVSANDISIQIVGDTLSIEAKRGLTAPAEGRWLRRERRPFSTARTVQLPFRVDSNTATASAKDGLLTVTVKRAAEDRPRTVAIQAS
ncbi:Hsp20/alpha crystallin family protein [Planctomycetota bacterium]|nr:Hsp20/alpha crystallin family protein [Planctomycetota bacterium]